MTAAQQVFDTAELLEIIICQCAPFQVQELKLVARIWRDMINSSSAVRRSRILQTAYFPDLEIESADEDFATWNGNTCTSYKATAWVRLNPAFKKVHYSFGQMDSGRTHYDLTIVLPPELDHSSIREQFVTTPPIAHITMGTRYWNRTSEAWDCPMYENACTAYNKGGLKIKDVLAVRDVLITTQRKFATHAVTGIETTIQAGFEIEGANRREAELEDRMVHDLFFQSFLPRYRKASHLPGTDFEKAKRKDRALDWHPSMDSSLERLYYDDREWNDNEDEEED